VYAFGAHRSHTEAQKTRTEPVATDIQLYNSHSLTHSVTHIRTHAQSYNVLLLLSVLDTHANAHAYEALCESECLVAIWVNECLLELVSEFDSVYVNECE